MTRKLKLIFVAFISMFLATSALTADHHGEKKEDAKAKKEMMKEKAGKLWNP